MLESIKRWWGLRHIKGFLEYTKPHAHCSQCGDAMDLAVVISEIGCGYDIRTGKLRRFVIVKACRQYRFDGSSNHDWFHREIWYDKYTLKWLESHKTMPGVRRAIDAVKDQSEPQLSMW